MWYIETKEIKVMKKFLLTFLSVGIVLSSLLPTTVALAVDPAPVVVSTVVAGFGSDWVILKGQITDDQGATINDVGFEYGATTSYGTSVNKTVSLETGDYFVMTIRGLSQGSIYHWRAFASYTGSAVGNGADSYFATKGSPVIEEYLNTGGDGDTAAIYGQNFGAMQFTSTANAHSVTTVRVAVKRVGSPGTVNLSIRHASSGLPTGVDLIDFTEQNGNTYSTSYAWLTFSPSSGTLEMMEGSTQYAIVISAVDGDASNYVMWQIDSGGGLADAVASHSTDGGITFSSDTPKDALFEVWGEPALEIVSANVFQTYITSGDLLFATEVINNYPPYATSLLSDPTEYFSVQLLDTDGLTVLASSPLRMWNNKPASIYLGVSSSSQLTVGAAYYINMVGNFSPYPNAQYQLTSADWQGTNKQKLYNWVINTANDMNDYYGVTGTVFSFTSNVVGGNVGNSQVISDFGNPVFATGIIGLETVLPSVFATTHSTPDLPAGTDQSNYDTNSINGQTTAALAWQVQVGSQIVSDANAVADLFGIPSGANAIGYGIALAMVIVMVIVMGSGGTALTGIILSSPLLLLGNYYRVISIQITVVFLVICTLLFIRQLWLKIN